MARPKGIPSAIDPAPGTGKFRVADEITPDPDFDSDTSIPVHRNRRKTREESGAFARALLDEIDQLARRHAGLVLPSAFKDAAAASARSLVEEWAAKPEGSGRAATYPDYSPPPQSTLHRWAFAISIATAMMLVLAIVVMSLVAMQVTNRLASSDKEAAVLTARVVDVENDQIALKAEVTASEADLKNNIVQIQARQDALIIYCLEGMDKLLKERKIQPPDIPPILQIAKSEFMLKSGRHER